MIENIVEDGLNDFSLIIFANMVKAGNCPSILQVEYPMHSAMLSPICAIPMSLSWGRS